MQYKTLVIVESPNKTIAIQNYLKALGYDKCKVLASYGHVSNLIKQQNAIDTEHNFEMKWENNPKSDKYLNEIIKCAKISEQLIIATDFDREGAAIGWHIMRNLAEKKIQIPTKRLKFHSITKQSIKEGMENLTDLQLDLVDAYKARLGLDFLVGFYISPILWRKLPGCMSAGRVQSAALRLIVELEYQRIQFKPVQYYSIKARFHEDKSEIKIINLNADGNKIPPTPTSLDAKLHELKIDLTDTDSNSPIKLERGCLYGASPAQLEYLLAQLQNDTFTLINKITKHKTQATQAPFITSTLQQEASNTLSFSPSTTMKLAQKLYEGVELEGKNRTGLITYMRTDNVHLDPQALTQCRAWIEQNFGAKYLHITPKIHKSKVRNAQEAHECIRPTNFDLTPQLARNYLDDQMFKLYDLIWRKAVASQMSNAEYEETTLEIDSNTAVFKATGNVQLFDGYKKLFPSRKDDQLPNIPIQTPLNLSHIFHEDKQTQPPSRLSSANLIANMEKLGIGRPSTYASIIDKLNEREYITLEQGQLVPTQRSWFLIAFLKEHFDKYVEYEFTAQLEEQLDNVANGQATWLEVLKEFWHDFQIKVENGKNVSFEQMKVEIGKQWHEYFFPQDDLCQKCGAKAMVQFYQGSGFIACSKYPDCDWKRFMNQAEESKIIGYDPQTEQSIVSKEGRYGKYLEWSANDEYKEKRISIPTLLKNNDMNLELALELAKYPKTICLHPESGLEIKAGFGRFGPYLLYDQVFYSLKANPMNLNPQTCLQSLYFAQMMKEKRKNRTINKENKEK